MNMSFQNSGNFSRLQCVNRLGLCIFKMTEVNSLCQQATGLDAWASRVKCPARFVSHLHEICIYIYMSCL